MPASEYQYFSQNDFRGGINNSQENLKPNQVLDSRDCWAPEGKLERRPAYRSAGSSLARIQSPFVNPVYVTADATTGILATAAGGPVTWAIPANTGTMYVGTDSLPVSAGLGLGINFVCPVVNPIRPPTQQTVGMLQYWDGSVWKAVQYIHAADSGAQLLAANGQAFSINQTIAQPDMWYFGFAQPTDHATTTINGITKFWYRFVFLNGVIAANNIGVPSMIPAVVDANVYVDYKKFLWNSGPRYINLRWAGTDSSEKFKLMYNRVLFQAAPNFYEFDMDLNPNACTPATYATIPEFNTTFMAYGGVVNQFSLVTDGLADTFSPGTNPFVAQINSDPLIVGVDPITGITSPYNPAVVPQLAVWPAGILTTYFKGVLWSAGFFGDINLIRWSAPAIDGAYNVWPEDSFEHVSTADDNSPITALAPLGDNLIVFKQDSIWQMVYSGLNDLQLPTFTPEVVVVGIGCVALNSIQKINGRLIFLSEDGFYAFDGTPNIVKMSDGVNATAKLMSPARKPFATAINWRTQHIYMCAVALNGSTENNAVFCFDYKHGSWWVWNMPVKTWIQESGIGLREEVYFSSSLGQFYQLERGNDDNGTVINNYILTGRFGESDVNVKTAREVRLRSENVDGTWTYQIYAGDIKLNQPTNSIVMDSPLETHASPLPPNLCATAEILRRERDGKPPIITGAWFQLKPMKFRTLQGLDIGYSSEGRRNG